MKRLHYALTALVLGFVAGHSQAAQNISFTNAIKDGKKVWEPASIEVKAGEDLTIKLVNTLPDVHGFEILGVTDQVPVQGGESKQLHLKAPKAGDYAVRCHMHPAHVGAKLIVK